MTYVEPVLIYFGGRRSCPTGQHIAWPCAHARPAAVLAPEGEALRFPVKLTTGHELCERHAADRREWTDLDPGSDVAKRLVRPGINLVQIGSPAVQLKYGESFLDAFKRICGAQVAIVDAICAGRTACRNLVPPPEIDPEQHCTAAECSRFFEHRASTCREIQWERCTCAECALLY